MNEWSTISFSLSNWLFHFSMKIHLGCSHSKSKTTKNLWSSQPLPASCFSSEEEFGQSAQPHSLLYVFISHLLPTQQLQTPPCHPNDSPNPKDNFQPLISLLSQSIWYCQLPPWKSPALTFISPGTLVFLPNPLILLSFFPFLPWKCDVWTSKFQPFQYKMWKQLHYTYIYL